MFASIVIAVLTMVFSGRLVARTQDWRPRAGHGACLQEHAPVRAEEGAHGGRGVVETKSKLPWITTPDLLTVWAVAFGLKDEIDDLIKETFETAQRSGSTYWAPTWYAGTGGISSVGNLASSIGSISTTASSSSGSGYGGGGRRRWLVVPGGGF
jgi:hypothetical protein